MRLILDTNVLGKLCYPRRYGEVSEWLEGLLEDPPRAAVFLPEIADYETRRELIRLVAKGQSDHKSIDRLDFLGTTLQYVPLTTAHIRAAAQLWADARNAGHPSASRDAFDGDVILAAQAFAARATVVTSNRKHLSKYGLVTKDWNEV
jgi:predicted nucleic acid-binding protein